MQFKSRDLEEQWNDARLRPDLKQLVSLADAYSLKKNNKSLIITSLFRDGYASVHGFWRGCDARVSSADGYGGSIAYFSTEQANDIRDFINWIFRYNEKYSPCLHHDNSGGAGTHLHFQVPDLPRFLSVNSDAAMEAFIRDWMTKQMSGFDSWE
jgi:hypothetical protein